MKTKLLLIIFICSCQSPGGEKVNTEVRHETMTVVNKAAPKTSIDTPKPTPANNSKTEFCKCESTMRSAMRFDIGTSACTEKEEGAICHQIYSPVCGCDGKEYSNDCIAAANGVMSWSNGNCSPEQTSSDPGPCTRDINTFGNPSSCSCVGDDYEYSGNTGRCHQK